MEHELVITFRLINYYARGSSIPSLGTIPGMRHMADVARSAYHNNRFIYSYISYVSSAFAKKMLHQRELILARSSAMLIFPSRINFEQEIH